MSKLPGAATLLALCATAAAAQAPDSLRAAGLDPLVVTAERTGGTLRSAAAAVTRLSATELARVPRATLADLLRLAPGFSLVDFDGLGFDPQLMVRGFYGGGEAEYVVVQVDGKPVTQLQTGLVAWDVLPPLASIEAIEIVRGGVSSLYGDAAIGGVINVITRSAPTARPRLRWDLGGGAFGTLQAGADFAGPLSWKSLALAGGIDRTDGFRDHAARTALRAQGSVALSYAARSRVALTLLSHRRDFEEPGPLLESLLDADRGGSDPLFRFDHTSDQRYGAVLEGDKRVGARTQLSGMASAELRNVDAIRTLALAPGFGDTKERQADNDRLAARAQLEISDAPLPGRLVFGLEGNRGGLDSKYYRYAAGTRTQYGTERGERGELDTQGTSSRTGGAVYAEYLVQAAGRLRLSLAARYDRLHDRFDPQVPSGQDPQRASHSAFSPKAGVNLQVLHDPSMTGNLYFTVSRSFKAPTLDQLYDQRSIPVPFPPFAITTSNPGLRPQHGTNVEAGIYQRLESVRGVTAALSLSGYQMDMKDELDFDITTFRYVNLGRSRHRGLEVGISIGGAGASGFANYTLQAATSRTGENSGKRLKAIPRHTLTGGLAVAPLARHGLLQASLLLTHVGGIFLDDANNRTLPNYSRLDAQLATELGGFGILLDLRNLLNAHYSSSGFLDPAGSGEAYLYPAAGRVIELGLRRGW